MPYFLLRPTQNYQQTMTIIQSLITTLLIKFNIQENLIYKQTKETSIIQVMEIIMDLGSLKNKYRTDDGLSFGKFNTQKKNPLLK